MAHWRAVLPAGSFYELKYEDLVADVEKESRALLDFAGLDWHEACLKPEAANTAIATASRWQARQPVTTSSCGRWKNYEKHLGLVAARLDGLYEH